ncbi:MAG: acyltransferase [Haliea sp.]|nr:acyltransferase [Haliea sp.]|tara:strand:- start:86508 stop:87695 length:1188 start_codon:yes stop_codon:yes gene_type:complete
MSRETSHAINLAEGLRRPSSYRFELECLRGLAILLVFFYHGHGITWGEPDTPPGALLAWIVAGNTGVTLFFVLSGFLLSLPWLQVQHGEAEPSIIDYLKARALRILPLYFAFVLFAGAISGAWPIAFKAATFQFVGFDIFPYSVVWWTLSTEVQFYLALPLACWLYLRGGTARTLLYLALTGWLLAYLYWALVVAPVTPMVSWLASKSLFGRLPAFAVGVALGWWYVRLGSAIPSRDNRLGSTITACVLLAAMTYLLHRGAALGDWNAERVWHLRHTWEAVVWALLIALLLSYRPLGSKLLLNRPMATMGKLSYSLYLNHVPVLFFLIQPLKDRFGPENYSASWQAFAVPVLGLLLSLLCARATYQAIERPFLRWKRKTPTAAPQTPDKRPAAAP